MSKSDQQQRNGGDSNRGLLSKTESSGSTDSNWYVKVVDEDSDEPIEIPAETDGLLLLSTLSAQFPGACGLKFKSSSGSFRGLRLDDAGRIHPPSADEGWGDRNYVAVFPKENTKRKMDDHVDASGATKLKRIERTKKCTDLIVLGLPFKTTEEELREYFKQFGELLVAQIKKDSKTGKSKGFGFIRYAEYDSQLKALSQRHEIEGRMCDAKIPNSKENANPSSRKIFVGRINETLTHEDLKEHFGQFGEVTDVFIPKPFRGFAFVSFTDPDVAESLCGEDYIIKGCSIHVSAAVPKDQHNLGGSSGGSSSRSGGGPMSRFGGGSSGSGGSYVDPFLHPPGVRSGFGGPSFGSNSPMQYGGGGGGGGPYSRPSQVILDPYNGPAGGHRRESGGGMFGGDYYPGSGSGGGSMTSSRYYDMDRGSGLGGGGHLSYGGRHSPYPPVGGAGGPQSEQASPQSKISRSQAWNSYSSTGFPMSGPGAAAAGLMFGGGGGGDTPSSWDVASHSLSQVQQQRSATPHMNQQQRSGGGTGAAATNQATASMGALNLNSLINPNLLAAAAQACLIAAASGAGGTAGPDFNALLSKLQMSHANTGPPGAVSAANQQNSGAPTSQSSWWPAGGTNTVNSSNGVGGAGPGGPGGSSSGGAGAGANGAGQSGQKGGGSSGSTENLGPGAGGSSGGGREESWR